MKKVLIKAGKTFIQAAVSYFCSIGVVGLDFSDKTVIFGAVASTLAAGFAALMNMDWTSLEETTAGPTDDVLPDENTESDSMVD